MNTLRLYNAKLSIAALVAVVSLGLVSIKPAHAQFDDSAEKSDSTKELPESKTENDEAPAEKNDFEKNVEITRAELNDLESAFKKRSEQQLVKAASNILSKDPNHLVALNTLAIYYFESKKLGLSKILIKRAMKDHPNEPALHNNLGIIYLSEGELRSALEEFRKSLAERSGYRIGSTNLSSIYLDYRDYKRSLAPLEESYRAARSDIRRGENGSIEIANNYGVALMGVGENSKAEDVFSEIANSNTRNPVPFLNYAILLVEVLKKKKDAVRVISKLKFMTDDRDVLRRVEELERKSDKAE